MPSELFLSALGSFTSKICLAIVVSPPLRPVGPYNGDRATSTRSALRWQSEVDVCDAPIGTSMRVFLSLLDCSFKITPPGWWVPEGLCDSGDRPIVQCFGRLRDYQCLGCDVVLFQCRLDYDNSSVGRAEDAGVSMVEKRPSSGAEVGLRK
ncbi:hypothetical protein GW17_00048286, partial [Ensete ventricosum]